MSVSKKLSLMVTAGILALGSVSANAAVVAKIEKLNGSALVERNGQRIQAKSGMNLLEGDRLMTLEKTAAQLKYLKSRCGMIHNQNTLVRLSVATQCAKGQVFGVGASSAAAAGAAKASAAAGSAAAATGGVVAGLGAAGIAAAVAGAVVVGSIVKDITDDDDNSISN